MTENHHLVRRVLFATPLLLALSIPISDGAVFRGFLHNFMDALSTLDLTSASCSAT